MSKRICFANQKGGVGKSTYCIQAAYYLAEAGFRVLVIDMDAQGNTSSRLCRTLAGEETPLYGTKSAQLFDHDLAGIEVMHCPRGMDMIHTPKNDPDLFEKEAADLDQALNPARNLRKLFDQYDYVLIDCPPSLGRKLIAALVMGTHVVCPVQLSGFATDGVEGLLETIIGIREAYNADLEIVGLLINKMDRSKNHNKALQSLEEAVPDLLLRNRVMHRPPLDTAIDEGIPVWSLRYGHVAANEVRAVLAEIISKVG